MSDTVFPYPGGKTYLADWIIEHIPEHDCYVEVFGGGGTVLVSKPRSRNEVYNDLDGDIVHFFRVLREHHGELVSWLNSTPYAKEVHDTWAREFYEGFRPEEDIERAGRFFYLRYSQYAARYIGPSGFSSSRVKNEAARFRNAIDELEDFRNRFLRVQIENRDFEEIIDKFDAEDTLFYCDPPYVDEGDGLYRHGEFDHDSFIDCITSTDGRWLISYTDIPDGLDGYRTVERSERQTMSMGHEQRKADRRVERLVMNYDPDKLPPFVGANQSGLQEWST